MYIKCRQHTFIWIYTGNSGFLKNNEKSPNMPFFWKKKYSTEVFDSEVKDLVEKYFDAEFYLDSNPDVSAAEVDPLEHFLAYGYKEGRDPTPWFSTSHYQTNPDGNTSNSTNPFYNYLKDSDPEILKKQQIVGVRIRDIQKRLEDGVLGEMVARATELEPLVRLPANIKRPIKMKPFHNDAIILMSAIKALHKAAEQRGAKFVIVIPHCRMSGATRIGGELAFALEKLKSVDDILLVRTDSSEFEYPQWFPQQIRNINFADISDSISKDKQPQLLFHFLRSLNPEAVFNINSNLFYRTTNIYGRQLASTTRVINYLFCADRNLDGHEVGYPVEHVYKGLNQGAIFVTDSEYLANTLRERYQLDAQDRKYKVRSLPTPVRLVKGNAEYISSVPRNSRPKIYWAGRFDRQKRIDLVQAIAEHMPECDFHLFGKHVIDNDMKLMFSKNVYVNPPFNQFTDLSLTDCAAWLYTAEWDGVPTIVLDVIASGTPLVTSNCGGIAEVVYRDLAEMVDDIEDINAYIEAINKILSNQEQARMNAEKLRDKSLRERSVKNYQAAILKILETE